MNEALVYLVRCSFINAVLVRLKRLRQPKYIVGALLGLAYFYFYFYRFLYSGAYQPRTQRTVNFTVSPEISYNVAALALFMGLVLFAWIVPAERTAITLAESEVAWLLPAPITRTQLLHYKLLKAQLGLLFLALFMTLVTGRLIKDGHGITHTLGWWIVLATFRLHRLGASFALTRLMDSGLSTLRRRIIVGALGLVFLGALIAWRQSAPSPPDLLTLIREGQLALYIQELVRSGPAPILLIPFRYIVRPWFANNPSQFVLSLAPALLILAFHYFWVIRSAIAFEEASVQLAEKHALWLAARKTGDLRLRLRPRSRQQPIFTLRPYGSPLVAFVWKAWIQFGGRRAFRQGGALAAALIVLAAVPSLTGHWRALGFLCGIIGFIAVCALLFGGPQLTAQSVRRELQAADIIKTAPILGWQAVLGQMLGPSAIFAGIQLLGLVLMVLGGFILNEVPHDVASLTPAIVAAAGVVLLPFNVVAGLIPTGVMLLFPGWFRPGEMRGLEATGLGLLMVFAQFVFVAFSLVAPALAAFGVGYLVHWIAPLWISILLGSLAATSTLCLEASLGAFALGSVLDRFDPGQEL